MKYLKAYNESKKYKPSLDEFISELDKELSNIGFSIRREKESDDLYIISIGEIIDFDGNTYIDFYYDTSLDDGFSIKALKAEFTDNLLKNPQMINTSIIDFLAKECNKYLDEDKSEWKCSDEVKDNYDLLCMTILAFLDEKNYGKIKK